MKKTFNSEAAAAIHEMAQGMFNNNLLSPEAMQEVEELCVLSVSDQSLHSEEVEPETVQPTPQALSEKQLASSRH